MQSVGRDGTSRSSACRLLPCAVVSSVALVGFALAGAHSAGSAARILGLKLAMLAVPAPLFWSWQLVFAGTPSHALGPQYRDVSRLCVATLAVPALCRRRDSARHRSHVARRREPLAGRLRHLVAMAMAGSALYLRVNDLLGPAAVELLSDLPDLPRWVEARGMLLSGRGAIVERTARSADSVSRRRRCCSPWWCVGIDPTRWPGHRVKCRASSASSARPRPKRQWPRSSRAAVARRATSSFSCRPHARGVAGKPRAPGCCATTSTDSSTTCRRSCAASCATPAAYSPIAAAFADERPVSFCYSGWETETHWDVSIDTLDGYRRRGLGDGGVDLPDPPLRRAGQDGGLGLGRFQCRVNGAGAQARLHRRRSSDGVLPGRWTSVDDRTIEETRTTFSETQRALRCSFEPVCAQPRAAAGVRERRVADDQARRRRRAARSPRSTARRS